IAATDFVLFYSTYPSTTEIYTLSLHDALPILPQLVDELKRSGLQCEVIFLVAAEDELLRRFAETRRKHPMSRSDVGLREAMTMRSEEHTSELQSLRHLVCRLLLEKKKNKDNS